MKKEGLSFKESVISLANQFSIEIPIVKNSELYQEKIDNHEIEILELITKYFEENLVRYYKLVRLVLVPNYFLDKLFL